MFGYEGGAESFGDLVGFPRTGTRMAWLNDEGKQVQRGHYRGPAHSAGIQGTPWVVHPGTGYDRYVGSHLARPSVPVGVQSFGWPLGEFWF